MVIPSGTDPADALDRSDVYGHVWEVLQALRSHDERFDAWVNTLDLNRTRDDWVRIIGVGMDGDEDESNEGATADATASVQAGLALGWKEYQEAIVAKIVERCGDRQYWSQWASSVAQIASTHLTRIRAGRARRLRCTTPMCAGSAGLRTVCRLPRTAAASAS